MAMFALVRILTQCLLLSIALWVNRADWRMLVLVAVIGTGIFIPIPYTSKPIHYYTICLIGEVLIIAVAVALQLGAMYAINVLSAGLGAMYVIGMIKGPGLGLSPYKLGVPILECGQLLACTLLSNPALNMFVRIAIKRKK